jgi:DNA-binding XRE family transcriptional regulator
MRSVYQISRYVPIINFIYDKFCYRVKKSTSSPVLPFAVDDALRALGQRIATARKARYWTQSELAAKAGVGLNSVVNIERGAQTVQIGIWFLVLWAMDLLDALEGVARLEDDQEGLASLKNRLPRRVRGSA